jgi:septal ring factor EnvC (AmiA/AmiB activator)
MKPFVATLSQETDQIREQSAEVEQAVARAEQHLSALRYGLNALHAQLKLLEHDSVARRRRLWHIVERLEALDARMVRGGGLP